MSDAAVTPPLRLAVARLSRARLATALSLVVGLLALALAAWGPGGLALDVGQPGDRLFLSGVQGDERADGRSYRWTRGSARVAVPGLGGAERVRVALAAESGRVPPGPVTVTVLVDGAPAGELQVERADTYVIEAERPAPEADLVTIELRAPTFRPAGDARDLGIILDRVSVTPPRTGWAPRAWVERWARLASLAGLLAVALWPLRRFAPAAVWLGAAGLVVAVAAAVGRPWLLAGWGWLAAGLAVAALAVHHRPAARAALAGLGALDRPRVATAALAALIAAQVVVMTVLAARIEWIGHADYADNAVVARNVVAGRGYTVNYVAQFYVNYPPTISHPSDVWPIFQPTLIAGSFLLFGVSTFAAKLPNIAAMAGLLATTAWVGRRLFGPAAGVGAAALLAVNTWFFENALFPVNDVPFSLLALLLVGIAARLGEPVAGGRPSRWWWPALGACAGLITAAKPSGALLALGVAAWLGWRWSRDSAWPGWRWVALGAGVAVLLVAPFVGRNLATFGRPFYSLQSYDAWVTKWEPPDENIYRLMAADPPHPRRLVGLGVDRLTEAVALQFRKFGGDIAGGVLIEAPLLVLAAVGLVAGGAAVRRTAGVLAWASLPYSLFVLVYWHYEERYFVYLIPWVGILAAGAVATGTRAVAREGDGVRRGLALGLLALGLALLLPPRLSGIAGWTATQVSTAGDVVIGEWLARNTPPEAVVMTRIPWQITWHGQRRTVMIPLAPAEGIDATIRQYGVGYVLIEGLGKTALWREALRPLYEGRELPGYTLVQEFRNPQGQPYARLYWVPASLRGGP